MDVFDNLAVRFVVQHAAHEGAFDLEELGAEKIQEVIGRVSAAEIIEREFASQAPQRLDVGKQGIGNRDVFAFSDLDDDRLARLAGRTDELLELRDKTAVIERAWIQVEEQAVAGGSEPQRMRDDVQVYLTRKPEFLGDSDEITSLDCCPSVLHACQSFIGDRFAGADVAYRLERWHEMTLFQGISQLESLAEDRHERAADVRRQDFDTVAPPALAVIKRDIRRTDQILGLLAVGGGFRHADAALKLYMANRQVDVGTIDCGVQFFGDAGGVADGGILQHHGKFITCQPRDVVIAPDGFLQQTGNSPQRIIPRRMAVGVIDELESVKVDDQQADRLFSRQVFGKDGFKLGVKVAPVVEAGQRVGDRKVIQVVLVLG